MTLPADFLNITSLVLAGGERGLLSMAFAPDYAVSRRFYVYYTAQAAGQLTIAEYQRVAANPDVADPASARIVLSIPHSTYPNHNGGQLQFGPDGYFYIGTGDGGGAGDPDENGQNLGTLLGKILRINPVGSPYTIPLDNPFVGRPGARGEIWSYGLRNPWRFSFDRQTGDLVIAAVGQNRLEEIDFVTTGSGRGRGVNACGRVYALSGSGPIFRLQPAGSPSPPACTPLPAPRSLPLPPPGLPPPSTATPPPAAARPICRVPRVIGLRTPKARTRILRASCRIGRVRYKPSARARGRVLSQNPRFGARRVRGARVHLTLSRGRR